MKPRGDSRGVALILVLLMISLIIAVTIQFNRDMRAEVYEAANLSDGIRLRTIAESGFYVGEAILLADKNNFDALTESWANAEMLSLKSEGFFEQGSFRLMIEDEGGRIPVNHLVSGNGFNVPIRDVLRRLLTGPYFRLGEPQADELLASIKDWIDADEEVTGSGAEAAYYAGLEPTYTAKNAPLDCIEELLMVKGMTRELFYGNGDSPGLTQCLTVVKRSGDWKININTAPKPVLRALAVEMTDEDVERFDEYRREEKSNLADLNWYKSLPRGVALNIPQDLIKVRSDVFRITAVGLQGRMTETITGLIDRGTADRRLAKLLSWKVE
jgi:general secretion pathway protein K